MHKDRSQEIIAEIEHIKIEKRKQKSNENVNNQKKRFKQADVDKLIVDFIEDSMLPFKIVENPSFVKLINTAFPNHAVMNRKKATNEVLQDFQTVKTKLTEEFEKIEYICVTCDCWSIYHR